jgi:hypothetical protein
LSNVMDTKDMFWHRHILTGCCSPKTRRPGAVAHMSLHLNQQCQRTTRQKQADNPASPLFTSGDPLSVYVGDQERNRSFEAAFPSGEQPSR